MTNITIIIASLFWLSGNALAQSCSGSLAAEFRAHPTEWSQKFQALAGAEKNFTALKITSMGDYPVWEFRREVMNPRARLVVTAGIHGNEAVAVDSAYEFMRRAPRLRQLQHVEVVVLPMMNPEGLAANTRRHPKFGDMNRLFAESDPPAHLRDLASAVKSEGRSPLPTLHVDLHGAPLSSEEDFFVVVGEQSLSLGAAALLGVGRDQLVANWADSFPLVLLRPADHAQGGGFRRSAYIFHQPGLATSETEGTLRTLMQQQPHTNSLVIEYPYQIPAEEARSGQVRILLAAIRNWEKRLASE